MPVFGATSITTAFFRKIADIGQHRPAGSTKSQPGGFLVLRSTIHQVASGCTKEALSCPICYPASLGNGPDPPSDSLAAALCENSQAAPNPANGTVQHAATDELPPIAVEDFTYPGADKILKEKGIKLVKGDGHILLSECSANDWKIKVEANKNYDTLFHCFKVTGKKGYVTMELPDVSGIWTENQVVKATLSSDGKKKTVVTEDGPNQVKTVGVADLPSGGKKADLLELRVG
ncbi:hypothetical protein [Streptomyces sp. Ac-502]|uniref:hypothetical protein n=1 Tax=Streptomyces sp. Ac-502 TaxID=3342801 RepID=UPI0038625DF0